ncbi:MAG: hypothetical protein CMP73_03575 [Flavobacteriales bacterium]|nr:hypothetical protein [Flavobacteriales bacterium]|tara:strand:+ start:168 stop:689 length:522 start_codon:yes stop_codon:yes gene_type:complete
MKKILYLFLVLPLLFSSCAKEEGCTDSQATNYNSDAEEDDGTCTYDITGVWTTTSAMLNGVEQLGGLIDTDLTYIWDNGDLGAEGYKSGVMVNYSIGTAVLTAGDPNVLVWSGDVYADQTQPNLSVPLSLTVNIDKLTNANNMTWRYVNYPTTSDTYVKTLVRCTTCSLNDWK